MKRFFFKSLVFLVACSAATAQPAKWKKLADGILQPFTNSITPLSGAIRVKDSIVLAGWSEVVLSTDAGKSWTKLSIPSIGDHITDVAIYDDHTFAIAGVLDVIYSSDQGKTWVGSGIAFSAALQFDDAPDRVIRAGFQSVDVIQFNGSTATIVFDPELTDIQRGADNSFYVKKTSQNSIYRSADDGMTWTPFAQNIPGDGDCFSLICDRTDSKRFVVISEDWAVRANGFSEIQMSSDGGTTWSTTLQKPLGTFTYLMGNATQGCNDYFVGTTSDGILRSSDKGVTWASIGGPPTPVDSRTISAKDDSIIYVLDTLGSIWVTDPVSATPPPSTEKLADIHIDTLGGDVNLPIHFTTTSDKPGECYLFFDTLCLKYKGAFDANGIDHTITAANGVARILYDPKKDTSLFGLFSFFPVDSNCTTVMMQSSFADSIATCAPAQTLIATICTPQFCGRREISRFMRYGLMPKFSVVPNPSLGLVSVSSTMDIAGAEFEIGNEAGVICYSLRSDIKKSVPLPLDLTSLPQGMYVLHVKGFGASIPFVIVK
jgi:photosystem II stability/assembly factor-like uncharacterized protein